MPIPKTIRLQPADAERYVRLRRRMLEDAPWAFGASPGDDPASDPAHLRQQLAEDEFAIVAVEEGAALVAVAGVMRSPRAKFRHRAAIWGVFVEPSRRGAGLGGAVLGAAIELARSWPGLEWLDIGVSSGSPGAQRLYERLGFAAWGREPEATAWGGERYDEIHMAMRL